MTRRERILAISVGAIVLLLTGNMGMQRLTKTLSDRETNVENLTLELQKLNNSKDAGKRAAMKLERLEPRSLPTDPNEAQSVYTSWLYQLANNASLKRVTVVRRGNPIKVPPLGVSVTVGPTVTAEAYSIHEFQLQGECAVEKVVELLGQFYDRDYLHRINKLTLTPIKQSSAVNVELVAQAVSLPKVPASTVPSTQPSGRLAASLDEYKSKILSRNPFSPPNNPPRFETGASHELLVGKDWTLDLAAKDPDGHDVQYELVTKREDLPDGLTMHSNQLRWRPADKAQQTLVVRAQDNGWPSQSSELRLQLKVVEPPPEKVETPPPTIDPAKQAFITGLVRSRSGAQGWIRSKAEGVNLEIFEGTEVNIGSVKAKVVSINLKEDYVEMDSDGSRWNVDMETSLADAFAKSRVD